MLLSITTLVANLVILEKRSSINHLVCQSSYDYHDLYPNDSNQWKPCSIYLKVEVKFEGTTEVPTLPPILPQSRSPGL